MKKDTDKLREEIRAKHGVRSDRELFKLLNIEGDAKTKILDWITYQCAYAYNSGYDNGIDDAQDTRDNDKFWNKGRLAGIEEIKDELRFLLKKDLEV